MDSPDGFGKSGQGERPSQNLQTSGSLSEPSVQIIDPTEVSVQDAFGVLVT